ncbi:MAG: hypothetical protein GYA66_14305 [Phyllobacteriaceae bacterium]|nr:hypothetical protein [Phyllobacteriaceae bacterium]
MLVFLTNRVENVMESQGSAIDRLFGNPAIFFLFCLCVGFVFILTFIFAPGGFIAPSRSKTAQEVPAGYSPATQSPRLGSGDQAVGETIATVLNLNGLLCASVLEVRPLSLENQYEVTCIEYGGGSGQVRYIFNALSGQAFKAG